MYMVTAVTRASALAGSIALWAISFLKAQRVVGEHIEHTRNPVKASRYAMNGMMVMVAGMIGIAVANEEMIAEPDASASGAIALFPGAGALLFLASYAWYMQVISRRWATIHTVALLILGRRRSLASYPRPVRCSRCVRR